ncbi:hypothetical protein Tsubulata_033402 [Turnera subulata]|uniref:Uncharacterized protein n=1 Tax=Turnera subulata TaxID=218843 RepID=A0A9Q0GB74_9ROSI|nr:hypothetical protein Tsubulata_033402 [Turnera subulata]
MESAGADSDGREFKNAEEMWREHTGDSSLKTQWYHDGVASIQPFLNRIANSGDTKKKGRGEEEGGGGRRRVVGSVAVSIGEGEEGGVEEAAQRRRRRRRSGRSFLPGE